MRSLMILSVCLLVMACVFACGQDSSSEATSEGSGADETPTKAAEPEQPAEPTSVSVDEFVSKLPAAGCGAMERCTNEELRGFAETNMMFMAMFASLKQDSPMGETAKQAAKAMDTEKRFLLKRDECEAVLGKLLLISDMSSESINEAVNAKTATFDGERALGCLNQLNKSLPEQCSTQTKLGEEIKMGKLKTLEKQFKAPVDEYMGLCEDIIKGTVEEGGACKSNNECKVGNCRTKQGEEGRFCKKSS